VLFSKKRTKSLVFCMVCEEKEKEDSIGCGRKLRVGICQYRGDSLSRNSLGSPLLKLFVGMFFFPRNSKLLLLFLKVFFVICYFGETRCKSLCKLELSVTIWDCWKSKWIMQIRFITSWEQTLKAIVFLYSYHSLCSSCLETFFCFFSKFTSLVVSLNDELVCFST